MRASSNANMTKYYVSPIDCTVDENVNFMGYDLESSGYPTFDNFPDCRAHCVSTYNATFFNWKPDGNGNWTHRCYCKYSDAGREAGSSVGGRAAGCVPSSEWKIQLNVFGTRSGPN